MNANKINVLVPVATAVAMLLQSCATAQRREETDRTRTGTILSYLETTEPHGKGAKERGAYITARLAANPRDSDALKEYKKLIKELKKSENGFDLHAIIASVGILHSSLPADLLREIGDSVANHDLLRKGATFNLTLMDHVSGYLAAQWWRGLVDSKGHDSATIYRTLGAELDSILTGLVHANTGEFGSPEYYGVDLSAVRTLAENAEDPLMQRKATMTLDWMMVALADSWDNGYLISAAGRSKGWNYDASSPDLPSMTSGIGWLYFGGPRQVKVEKASPEGLYWMSYPGRYKLPSIIAEIARAREAESVSRTSIIDNTPGSSVRYTSYLGANYGLASAAEVGVAVDRHTYKEERRTFLKWVSPQPGSTFTVVQDNRAEPTSDDPNAFAYGENPYCRVLQSDRTLLGVYAVPSSYPFYKMHAPFSQDGAIVKMIQRDGWFFVHGGTVLFGFKSAQPMSRDADEADDESKFNLQIYTCNARSDAWVLETAPIGEFSGGGAEAELNRFATAVTSRTKLVFHSENQDHPSAEYTNLAGKTLRLQFSGPAESEQGMAKIGEQVVNYRNWPLLSSPWVDQQVGSNKLTLHIGSHRLEYDFGSWTSSE